MAASADFRRVFEVSAEPQLLLASGAVVICVTDGYLRAAGVSREQVVGQSLFQIPPYARCDEATKRLLQDELEKVWRSGLQFPHPSRGGTAPALSVPVLDDAGVVQQIVHTLRPVTRPSEASESDSERRLRKLIEYTYDGIVLLDPSGKPFYASPSIERVCGFTVDELMNSSLLDLVHPEDLPRFGQAVKELLGQPGGVMVIQYRALHRDGHWQILETAAVNRLDDPDVLAIVATSRDVSERVNLQDELRTRNEELQVVLTAAKAIGWDRDVLSERPTRYFTDPAAFFCPSPEERASFDRDQIVHPDDLPAIEAAVHRAAETGDDLVLEFRGWPRPSETRHYASHGRVFCDKPAALRAWWG